jgi:DNA-directed RNA polymerase subunit K/omega
MSEGKKGPVTRQDVGNAFEFVTVAGQRAKQLLNGCVPKVDEPGKPARVALREVASGVVRKVE